MFLVCSYILISHSLNIIPSGRGDENTYRSQAILAQAKARPSSSSAFRLLILDLDWASRELASSTSSGGRGPESLGMISCSARSMGLLILNESAHSLENEAKN
jgi:hypothetical protein